MIGDMDDFTFYLRFTKPLVLNLPDAKDRTTAALWVKKLRDMNAEGEEGDLRIEYLKLLLFVMQRNKLSGIFEKPPPEGALEGFPANSKATDMMSLVKPAKAEIPAFPSVFTSVGGDLCQFVAIQEIPNFGLHGYYAISAEPLSKWAHSGYSALKKSLEKVVKNTECFKNTCNKSTVAYVPKGPPPGSRKPPASDEADGSYIAPSGDGEEGIKRKSNQLPKPAVNAGQYIPTGYQAQRKDIAGVETRPCWGRNRYFERLIDESPHFVADLDLSQADALLHLLGSTRMKKVKKGSGNVGCEISAKRRQVERMMDLPPCSDDPGDDDQFDEREPHTCLPRLKDCELPSCDESEGDSIACRNRSGISLRGGSDRGSCCGGGKGAGQVSYKPEFSHMTQSRGRSRDRPSRCGATSRFDRSATPLDNSAIDLNVIFDETDNPMDIDVALQNATVTSRTINPHKTGNFKWLKDIEQMSFNDPHNESISKAHMRPFSSEGESNEFYRPEQTDADSDSQDEPPIDDLIHPEDLMPQTVRRCPPKNVAYVAQKPPAKPCFLNTECRAQTQWSPETEETTDYAEDDSEPSMAILRKRMIKSREAKSLEPEVHDKTYVWKEILDHTGGQLSRSQGLEQGIDPDEYMDYINTLNTEYESGADEDEDEDEEDEEEEPRRPRTPMYGGSEDSQEGRIVKGLLGPKRKPPPSPGNIVQPIVQKGRKNARKF